MKRLERYVDKGGKRLRMGYTTGTCAAGAAGAAARMLLEGEAVPAVRVRTPSGVEVELEIEWVEARPDRVRCAVRKDAGDDPDVTDGALVCAEVSRLPDGSAQEAVIEGGEGVGVVTMTGLACAVGEAAINPVPRRMIHEAAEAAIRRAGYGGGLRVVISVPGGEALAARTFNPRLGIRGGISVLGTSGLVEPMSEAALVDTLRLEIGARRARGERLLLLVPGNYGRDCAREALGLDLERAVKCSNFIGEALDAAVLAGFQGVLLLGHAGKLVKLAAGVLNTHSRVADGRMEVLCTHAGLAGVPPARLRELFGCVSVDAADALLVEWGVSEAVWRGVGARVLDTLRGRAGPVRIEFGVFGARGLLCHSPGMREMAEKLRGEAGE